MAQFPTERSPMETYPKMGRFRDVKLRNIPRYVQANELYKPLRFRIGLKRLMTRYGYTFMGQRGAYKGRLAIFTPMAHVVLFFMTVYYVAGFQTIKRHGFASEFH